LKEQVLAEIAALWKGRSKDLNDWYERACRPAVEKGLEPKVKEFENWASKAELKGLGRVTNEEWCRRATPATDNFAAAAIGKLTQAAQDRIAAAEIEATMILKRSKIPAERARTRAEIPWAKPEAWRDSKIQEQKRFEQTLFEIAGRDSLREGRQNAAAHLFVAVADEHLKSRPLDVDQFNTTLKASCDWACAKFDIKSDSLADVRQAYLALFLRRRAAAHDSDDGAESRNPSPTDSTSTSRGSHQTETDPSIDKESGVVEARKSRRRPEPEPQPNPTNLDSETISVKHATRVAAVERNFGCNVRPPLARFYEPLKVTNSEFCAWKRQDFAHCGRAKRKSLDRAADELLTH